MPDIFIPLDTTFYSDYYRNLLAKGVMNKTIVNYVNKNSNRIREKYPTFESFNKNFIVEDALLNELIQNGEENGIHFNEKEFNISKPFISLQIKAVIARDLWTTTSYYKIMNQFNTPLKKALDILSETKDLKQYLKTKL